MSTVGSGCTWPFRAGPPSSRSILAVVGRNGSNRQYKPLDAQTTRVSDRSLDEFAGASTGSDEGGGDDDADPSRPTMRWSAEGAACDACGTVVSRRWQGGESFVCADCKEW
jgi:hypothetical protein